MTARIQARHIYQGLSLILVGLTVAVAVHQLQLMHHLFFGTRLTIFQMLPSAVFALLPFAMVLARRPATWPRPIELLAILLMMAIGIAMLFLLFSDIGPSRAQATWPNYFTGLRAFACLAALATLLAACSPLLARVPPNVYRVSGFLVLIAGAAIDFKIAGMVERGGTYAFISSYVYLLTLGVLILVWTEARLPQSKRMPALVWLAMASALFGGCASIALGIYYTEHTRGDDFWTFLYGFLPTITAALCMLIASRSVDVTMPGVRPFGRVVGLSIIALELCLARWFAYVFFPGGIDETWRFLQFVSNLLPLGLLLLVQFEVFAGDDNPSPSHLPEAPTLPSPAVSR